MRPNAAQSHSGITQVQPSVSVSSCGARVRAGIVAVCACAQFGRTTSPASSPGTIRPPPPHVVVSQLGIAPLLLACRLRKRVPEGSSVEQRPGKRPSLEGAWHRPQCHSHQAESVICRHTALNTAALQEFQHRMPPCCERSRSAAQRLWPIRKLDTSSV